MYHDLKPDEIEIANAIVAIKRSYFYKRDQLIKALDRNPSAHEMFEVAHEELKILASLWGCKPPQDPDSLVVIPASLMVQTFLTKLLQDGILSSSTEEIAHDQPE
jgi:hypothetical protein